MFGSDVLEVAIGLIFVYLLLSVICSAVNETIEAWLKKRGADLERGIRELLHEPEGTGYVQKLYNHPLVYGLFKGDYMPRLIKKGCYPSSSNLPSYIPSGNFALALMDVVLPATSDTLSGAARATTPPPPASAAVSAATPTAAPASPGTPAAPLKPFRDAIAKIENNSDLRKALLTLVDAAGDDVSKARQNIEAWYNSTMDRVAGWYKRRVQVIILCLGFFVAVIVNVDTITIGKSLSHSQALRSSLVGVVQEYAKNQPQKPYDDPRVTAKLDEIRKLGLPIGWNRDELDGLTIWHLIIKVIGWSLTAIAISLGAPFWFDLLNKFMVARSTIKPAEKES